MDTYWQSDGQLPHLVNIQFQRKTAINQIYIYTDYKLDESYTPSRISIRSGTHFNDLQEVEIIDLHEPSGKKSVDLLSTWISVLYHSILNIILHSFNSNKSRPVKYIYYHLGWVQIPIKDIREKPIKTFMIQIAVISNHQNGRDTHMRQIRIHSPIQGRQNPPEDVGRFTTIEFQQYGTIR